jgi:hypothetical protein
MADNWATIREYVAGAQVTVAPADAVQPAPRAIKAIRQRQANLAAAAAGPAPSAAANPADFAAAVQAREASVREKDAQGQDIPRKYESIDWLKPVYKAHDALVSLPRPGGIGVLVAVLAVFFIILIPATSAGETRALLLWDVLLGKKRVYDANAPQLGTVDGGTGNIATFVGAAAAAGESVAGLAPTTYYNILGQQIQPPGVG